MAEVEQRLEETRRYGTACLFPRRDGAAERLFSFLRAALLHQHQSKHIQAFRRFGTGHSDQRLAQPERVPRHLLGTLVIGPIEHDPGRIA